MAPRHVDPLEAFPGGVLAPPAPEGRRYVRRHGLFAVHGPVPRTLAPQAVATLNQGAITICRGSPPLTLGPQVSAVYGLGSQGALFVPTGRILVRFAEGTDAAARRPALARVGFTILEVLSYAPHAAWVQADSGGIAAALNGLPALMRLPDVAHVEPQFLSERAAR